MLVWVLVGERTVRAEGAGWVVGVVHARTQIGVGLILVLVVEAEGVAYLLAHHHVSPCSRVVLRGVEVSIVDLGSACRDVAAAAYPDLSEAEPPVRTIRGVADLDPTISRTASRVTCGGFVDRGVQHA